MDLNLILVTAVLSLAVGVVLGWLGFRSLRGRTAAGNSIRQEADPVRLRGVFEFISQMTATLRYERVLELVLDLGGRALHGSSEGGDPDLVSAVFLFSEQGESKVLSLGTSRQMVRADQRVTLPAASGVLARVIEEGEPVFTKQIRQDPELCTLVSLQGCSSLYCLPLRVELDTYGVVFFAHPQADYFNLERRDVLQLLTHQAVIALQNARLYSELEDEKERIMEAQEAARNKLARDLHDGPTQSVSAIAMRLNFTRRLLKKDSDAAGEELLKIEEIAKLTAKEIRHMLFTLRPLALESQGLTAALRMMADKMKDTYNQDVTVRVDEAALVDLEISRQTVIFYIIEEAVNNARKHAQASYVEVQLRALSQDMLLLEIKDDGVGFDMKAIGLNYENRGSLGMVNLRERSELISGVLRIETAQGAGTAVQVVIPVTEAAVERLRQRKEGV